MIYETAKSNRACQVESRYCMTEEEVKQNLIDRYSDLLRIKHSPHELDVQLAIIRTKLSSYDIDLKSIEDSINQN